VSNLKRYYDILTNNPILTHPQAPWWTKMWVQTGNNRKAKSRATLPGSQHLREVEGCGGVPGWDYKEWQASTTHTDLHKTNTWWLVHSWSTFGARTNHGQTWTHKTHHGPDLGEATTFPLILYFVPPHEAHIQMVFCLGTPKWESQNCQSWDSHNFETP